MSHTIKSFYIDGNEFQVSQFISEDSVIRSLYVNENDLHGKPKLHICFGTLKTKNKAFKEQNARNLRNLREFCQFVLDLTKD